MYSDGDGHAPQWLGWLLTGATLVGLTALSVFTFGAAAPISGVAAGVIIGATCGAYAGAITSVVSQGINSGWSNIDSWNVFKEAGVGLVSGAISGLGVGIGTSILTGGISQITSGLFDGSISSFSDALCQFAYGALISGVTYGLGKYISNKMATSKIGGIIGTSSKNSVINKRLADAGFSNLKVGVKGLSGVVKELYNYYGYSAVFSLLSNGSSALISILGGIF